MSIFLEGYADRDLVADVARLSPIPEDLREYVVGLLAGEIKRPKGPRRVHLFGPAAWVHEDKLYDRAWAFRVVRWKRVFEREKERTGKSLDPYRSALARVSEESCVSEDALDRWLYPRGQVDEPTMAGVKLATDMGVAFPRSSSELLEAGEDPPS